MNNSPFSGIPVGRMVTAGAVLGVLGIVLFIILWTSFGSAGMSQLPRLLLSMCIPPAVIAVIVGVYVLFFRPKR